MEFNKPGSQGMEPSSRCQGYKAPRCLSSLVLPSAFIIDPGEVIQAQEMEVKELTCSCCPWPPWNSTVSPLSSQGPWHAEPRLLPDVHPGTARGCPGMGNAVLETCCAHPERLWCHPEPCWWGLSSAGWLFPGHSCLMEQGCGQALPWAIAAVCSLFIWGAGCALQVCLWASAGMA